MLPSTGAIPNESLSRLHSEAIDGEAEILDLLRRAQRAEATLESRLNRRLERQRAKIGEIDARCLLLRTQSFDAEQPPQIFLNLALDGRLYFFSVQRLEDTGSPDTLRVALPGIVFYAERRDRPRRSPSRDASDPTRVVLHAGEAAPIEAAVDDLSPDGLLLRVAEEHARALPGAFQVSFLDGARAGEDRFAAVRHDGPGDARGWRRIGVSTSAVRSGPLLAVDRRDAILPAGRLESARRRLRVLGAGARLAAGRTLHRTTGRAPARPEIHTVDFQNERGERLRGILDACGDLRGAPLVLIPPAWAKTKETLLPLARTIVDTFEAANESVGVVRLDGIRRRGESHNDPACAAPGRECHHMTFSQGAADIRAAVEHFREAEGFRPSTIVLVTFSGAAIEARRALAEGAAGVGGWVSVVGAADLKSGLRTVSGGVDYIGGFEQGVRFGIQRILGIEVDMDRVAEDAVTSRMAYLEDARCEMEKLELPITWIQGRYDAWIDAERVREILSCGDSSRRRLIDVPTGHQLRSSREALETFQLIAQEIARIVLDREVPPVLPDLARLERRREAERARLPKTEVDLQHFWCDYLLGRDRRLGMELLTVTTPYRDLMRAQVTALDVRAGTRIADLGSGTGAFPLYLLGRLGEPGFPLRIDEIDPSGGRPLRIDEIDYVGEALARARERLAAAGAPPGFDVHYRGCDLERADAEALVPVPDGTYDRVLASLLLNYVQDPARLLEEGRRLLRPGGRLVLSTLRRDVDISRIYRDVSSELRSGAALRFLGVADAQLVEDELREFLNEAARLIDLEERGIFHFWDAGELVTLLREAGFVDVETGVSFGDPPQAIVASAVKP